MRDVWKWSAMSGVLFTLVLGLVPAASAHGVASSGDPQYSEAGIDLRMAMRTLWEDHIVWTRNYIISALADSNYVASGLAEPGDTEKVAERLLRNQEDIGQAIEPFYGQQAADQLTALLKDHIVIATRVVSAAKQGDKTALNKSQVEWRANANDIATFLSGANPNWPKATLVDMLGVHLEVTTTSVVSRLKKDWAGDIAAYDHNHEHMLMLADALSAGIINQFPDRFR